MTTPEAMPSSKHRRRFSFPRPLGISVASLLLAFCLAGPAAWGAPVGELENLDPRFFPVPAELEPNVAFWTKVYTEYDHHHVLLHDERYLGVIYAVIDFTALDDAEPNEVIQRRERRKEIQRVEAKYHAILNDLAAGRASKDHPDDQARVEKLFEGITGGPSKYSAAASRLRTQTCLKNRFAEGIERSGLFMAEIERIFVERGLPIELTRLPFVESLFQIRAHSSAAAAGIWQFMRATAQRYLEMEIEYDERYDPLRATEAAAAHLDNNFQHLGTWPLAVTAYNHGENGMKRAVRLLGTQDLGQITERYRSRTFGFASRNFYATFVAAAQIYANREHYFPGIEPLPPLAFDVFEPSSYVSARELARESGVPLDEIRELNPALAQEIWNDHLYVPVNYRLRVPVGQGEAVRTAFASLPDNARSPHQVGLYYRVRGGDTLGKIAARFGTTVGALQRANNLRSAHVIRQGQQLLIPPGSGGRGPVVAASAIAGATAAPTSHVVRPGESLSLIARRYGVSLTDLQAANRLADADRIHAGQRLTVPTGAHRTHVVRPGDTLTSIARLYGSTVQALRAANRLLNDVIRPAQVLIVP